MTNGNGLPPPITFPTFAPTVPPGEEAVNQPFRRRPLIRTLELVAADALGIDGDGITDVIISEPTLIKLDSIPSIASDAIESFAASWRPKGTTGRISLDSLIPEKGELPFIGPYAYIQQPGSYEILLVNFGSTPPATLVTAQQMIGFPVEDYKALLDTGVHYLLGFQITVTDASAQDVASTREFFFIQYRNLYITNQGANAGQLLIGARNFPMAVGDTIELGPNFIGRNSIRVISDVVGGSTFEGLLGFW